MKTTSIHSHITQKETYMKSTFKFIAEFFTAISQASYAAHLARNGQYERAKAEASK